MNFITLKASKASIAEKMTATASNIHIPASANLIPSRIIKAMVRPTPSSIMPTSITFSNTSHAFSKRAPALVPLRSPAPVSSRRGLPCSS